MDIGPGAGEHGGEVVAAGTVEDIMACEKSLTGAYLSGRRIIPVPEQRKEPTGFITVRGAKENNLKNVDVKIPLGVMTCVTGVSGSGKSSLVNEILYKHLARTLNRARCIPGKHKGIDGLEQLIKSSVLISRQSEEHRVPILRLIPVCLIRFVICLQQRRMRKHGATKKGVSASMSKGDAARHVPVMAS